MTKSIEYDLKVNRLNRICKFYNMKEICQLANVSYNTFKGWKYKDKEMSEDKIDDILKAMKYAYISL